MAHYGQRLEELRGLAQQLAAIDALGTEQQRDQLQALVDQVRPGIFCGSKVDIAPAPC